MTRDTESVFAQGAVIVPDFVTPAEEERILLRIAQAPWMTELRRRVQHYGYRYSYSGTSRPEPAAPFPRWASVMADRLRDRFAGALRCSASSMSTGRARGSACTPTTATSAPSSPLCRSPPTGRCASVRAPCVPTPATGCRATRSRCSPAARCSSSRALRARRGCTVSTAPTPPARPPPASRRPSGPSRRPPAVREPGGAGPYSIFP